MARFFTILFLLLLLCAGGGYGAWKIGLIPQDAWWLELSEAMKDKPQVRLAAIAVETGRSGDATVIATGYLESRRQAKIGARAAGRIEAVNVEEGDRVTAQQVLAVLEHADLDASLAATKATAARANAELAEQEITILQAKRDYQRAGKLKDSSSISEAEFEEARFKQESAIARRDSLKAAVDLAEARVREAEQMKENMYIRAPFDGTVISKDAEVGESILPGGMGEASGRGSAVTIADLSHLEVDCDVKEDYISRVTVNQPAEVAVDAVPDRKYQGRVRKIIPMGDRARATIKVKVEIINADERLFPDMSGTVYFLPDASNSEESRSELRRVFCTSTAIQKDQSQTYVWKVDRDDRVHRNNVRVGTDKDGRVEILEGLSGAERVIVTTSKLTENQMVKINQ